MHDLHREVTERIVAQLKAGTVPWKRPWDASFGLPRNALTKTPYSGVNLLLLWAATDDNHFTAPYWLTYKQAASVGAQVRKGEHGTRCVFASSFIKEDANGDEKRFSFLKYFTVFNIDQIDNLPVDLVPALVKTSVGKRLTVVEKLIANSGAKIVNGGEKAFYSPVTDTVQVPVFAAFHEGEHFYATVFHELGHWTGNTKRLNREFGKRFGDRAYSVEELVAELTSAFLCAEHGIDTGGSDAAYIDHWVKFLSEHDKAIFAAASAASKAVAWIDGSKRTSEAVEPELVAA